MTTDSDSVLFIDNWLLNEASGLEISAIVDGLAHRLCAAGLPLDRFGISFGVLNPSLIAVGIIWRPGEELTFTRFHYESRDSGLYERSPFKAAVDRGTWLDVDLPNTPDDTYDIVAELKAEGLKHYIVIPLTGTAGRPLNLTLATKSSAGFSPDHREIVRMMLPALRAVIDIKTLNAIMRDVLSAYVGRTPAREIVAGTVHRGQVTEVRAAILVADLRGFTRISTRLPAQATADVINRYYDLVVPPIEAYGGEVLKFIGDAVLAIFPAATLGDDGAVLAALDAAHAALSTDVEPFVAGGHTSANGNGDAAEAPMETIAIQFGIAIHLGDAVYGNVGSGDRLDFTVIGRDVNVAARIATLCSRLGRDYLVSEEVAEIGRRHGRRMADAGAHAVRGLSSALRVYVPDIDELAPAHDDGVSHGIAMISGG